MIALAAAAVALLLWPPDGGRRAARVRQMSVRARPPRSPGPTRPRPPAAAVAGLATLLAAAVSTPLVAVLAGVVTGVAARAWTRATIGAAQDQRQLALIQGLAALAADLRGGRSLPEATRAAAAACGDERTGAELSRAIRAPEQAMPENVGDRGGPWARLAGAVLLSGRTGCSLAEVVSAVEDDLRARHRHGLELRAATAGPRAGALLLAGLPVLGLAMGSGVGADPWRVLTTTGTGQVLLLAGVALEVVGVTWSSRLVRRAVR